MSNRSCVVCRTKADKKDLLRFTIYEGELLFDFFQKIPQRGSYVCYNYDCLKNIKRRYSKKIGDFNYSFEDSLELVKNFFIKSMKKIIMGAFMLNKVTIGTKFTTQDYKDDVSIVLVAQDIAKNSLKSLEVFNKENIFYLPFLTKGELGEIFKKSYVAVIGIKKNFDFNKFKKNYFRYRQIFSQEHEWLK